MLGRGIPLKYKTFTKIQGFWIPLADQELKTFNKRYVCDFKTV